MTHARVTSPPLETQLAADGSAAAAWPLPFLPATGIHGHLLCFPPVLLSSHRGKLWRRDTAKARTAYQDFFALWKDADPDITILKEAKAEYAKLQ